MLYSLVMATEIKKYSIFLQNVDNEHCAHIVRKGIEHIEGINDIDIQVNNSRLTFNTDKPEFVIPAVVSKIRDLGYDVNTSKKRFPVTGLSCASCAISSSKILSLQPGVLRVDVNFANSMATIEYISTITDPGVLKNALIQAGYDMTVDEDEDTDDVLSQEKETQHNKLRSKVIGAILLSVPLMIIGMFFMEMPYANYIMWALSTPLLFYYGKQFFLGAWKQARNYSANMDTLVAVSTGIAYIFSVFNTLFPEFWHSRGLHSHVYFEAAGVIITFILIGKLLEEKAKGNTSSAIRKLMKLQPKEALLIQENGETVLIPIKDVQPGDIIMVKPGEQIPVDGAVVSGSSYIDESMISGEPVPVSKSPGDKIFAGTINQKSSFRFKAEKIGAETFLAQIIAKVEEAQGSRAPIQQLVDKIASVFVPAVFGIATISFIIWMIFGGENAFSQGLMTFVTVLVIACPCALGLATPTAIMVGMGKGAEQGILIKDAESLQQASKIEIVLLDKTGTITEGTPAVTDVFWENGCTEEHRNILYSIEKMSEHPLADAIVFHLADSDFISEIHVENIPGEGIKGKYKDDSYFIGNSNLMQKTGVIISVPAQKWIAYQLEKARTVVFYSKDTELLGCIAIADRIKKSSANAISKLQKDNIRVIMLTGDNEKTAEAVAEAVGITEFHANVLPDKKADVVRELQHERKVVAMVGDGINDTNALALADVSIAMAHGSDIAMDVAKMTIISSDLEKIPEAIHLSQFTVKAIQQNLFWAFIYNLIGIPLAAGILYPVNGTVLDPMWAAAAMAFSSVSVVANSLRLKWKKL